MSRSRRQGITLGGAWRKDQDCGPAVHEAVEFEIRLCR